MSDPIAEILAGGEYNEARLNPQPGQADYLHLRDLRDALEPFVSREALRILDYGCGGSPYRSLFPNAEYRRADFTPMAGLDYQVGSDSRIAAPSASFDLVLSTQVLEHVAEPATYLQEAARVLRPGGRLLLTTHGVYPEHGCPYDFSRWTTDGLRNLVNNQGLVVEEARQLTCDFRALQYLWDLYAQIGFGSGGLKFGEKLARYLHRRFFRRLSHRLSDRWFPESKNRLIDEAKGGSFYIALLIAARKPASDPPE